MGVLRTSQRLGLGLLFALAIVFTAREARYMTHPDRTSDALGHGREVRHCCLTAYANAVAILDGNPAANPWGRRADAAQVAPFHLDAYQYPPPFLLLVRGVRGGTRAFAVLRLRFFIVQAAALALALAALWLMFRADPDLRGLAPALILSWLSYATLDSLQKGNVQVLLVALAIGAVLAYERDHDVLGGALLALPIVTKAYPAVLLVAYLAQRRWRRVGFALAWTSAWVVAGIPVLGLPVYRTFVTWQLPRLLDGAAFSFMTHLPAGNHSVQGIVIALHALGLPVWLRAAHVVGLLYAGGLLAAAAIAGKRWWMHETRGFAAVLGSLALVALGERTAPFAPTYTLVLPTIIALLLLSRTITLVPARQRFGAMGLIAAMLVLWTIDEVIGHGASHLDVLLSLATSLSAIGVAVVGLCVSLTRPTERQRYRGEETAAGADLESMPST